MDYIESSATDDVIEQVLILNKSLLQSLDDYLDSIDMTTLPSQVKTQLKVVIRKEIIIVNDRITSLNRSI